MKSLVENSNLKVNKSTLARKMGVDRRTIGKYINGYTKPTKRKIDSACNEFYAIIKKLLSDKKEYVSMLY